MPVPLIRDDQAAGPDAQHHFGEDVSPQALSLLGIDGWGEVRDPGACYDAGFEVRGLDSFNVDGAAWIEGRELANIVRVFRAGMPSLLARNNPFF